MRAPVLRVTGSLVGGIVFMNYLPFAATYGVACLPMYGVVGLAFFLPLVMVTADLAVRLPEGGIQAWVTEAFGRRFGLFAVYVQWLVSLTFQPAALSYAATAAALAFHPPLVQSRMYTLLFAVISTWALALLSCTGWRSTSWMVTLSVALGVMAPLVIVMAVVGLREADILAGGKPLAIPSWKDLLPSGAGLQDLKQLTGMLFQFGGVELYAAVAPELPNSGADYRRAVRRAAALVFSLYVAGTLVITLVAPPSVLAPHATLLGALEVMGMESLRPPMACLAAIGGLGMSLAWVLPPMMGLVRSLRLSQLLPSLQATSARGVPLALLALQSALISVLCGLFLLEDVGATFWVFTAVSAQLQLIMYITMFVSALRILSLAPGPRPTRLYCAATVGLLTSAITLCLGFAPPKSVDLQVGWHATFMSLAVIVVSAVPLAMPDRRRAISTLAIKTPGYSTDRPDAGGHSPALHPQEAVSWSPRSPTTV